MKFSIAVLSSILAVCSVTVANPVDHSSTMSAKVSTATVPPSATETASAKASNLNTFTRFDYPKKLKSYNEFGKYCYSIGLEGVFMIEEHATLSVKIDKIEKDVHNLDARIKAQKNLLYNLEQDFDFLNRASGQGSVDLDLETNIRTQREFLDELQEILQKILDGYRIRLKKDSEQELELKHYFEHHHKFEVTDSDDNINLESYHSYKSCFDFFYSYFSSVFLRFEQDAQQQALQP
ncbi:hypothetical protein BATDEDRAFT_92443 [Batrachochytrium dendrobatidis JAM81]|uniref:Uncharacterized protein n=1 Tax=Batrachochytrium dendrobatidis (strain JAM81 / FGSC 10211) TaxID=684364 RepID=F4PD66_BATDJ|nr:uncharacterized protein BATDEDRAFT_92443 [Batrachochytrium dendrobatidis JAM81]EGF76733.1 hypothetical protein BATDEDRAFT_92443 [Batrachochytrium dendrobatidis JAM81]|eukprot:XP_006682701.1 hypothetical protein BATDEDRAFT_92443 [Batrachochytrium dendrobatidis JAM81]